MIKFKDVSYYDGVQTVDGCFRVDQVDSYSAGVVGWPNEGQTVDLRQGHWHPKLSEQRIACAVCVIPLDEPL